MPLSRHNVGTYPETSSHTTCQDTFVQSSQPAQPLWADPGRKNGISMRELVSTSKKKKKSAGMNEWLNILKSSQTRKKPSPYVHA